MGGHEVGIAGGAQHGGRQLLGHTVLEVHVRELLGVETVPNRVLASPPALRCTRRRGHSCKPEKPVLRTQERKTGYIIISLYKNKGSFGTYGE